MDMVRYIVEAHRRMCRSVAEFDRTHDVHRSLILELLAGNREHEEVGLEVRSCRPRNSSSAASHEIAASTVVTKELSGLSAHRQRVAQCLMGVVFLAHGIHLAVQS
ncbi:MAG TPA: hypothetical protein VMU99_04305 [Acidimicrobiales bacterium]|nr:hypothetical protein [Acidimicrobiales bacterium]